MKDRNEGELDPKKKPEASKGRRTGRPGPQASKGRRAGRTSRPEKTPAKKEYNFIATHTVVSGDTLSGLAKKFYGSEAQAFWMEIYEANKDVIGDSPNVILIGQVLNIPEKPKL
jgi:nucleoid-associated protein YgaU